MAGRDRYVRLPATQNTVEAVDLSGCQRFRVVVAVPA
jgi:hypothetical protein